MTDSYNEWLWDAYKVLIETRNLEINLFWQRSNYFLVLNTGLALGFFNVKQDPYKWALAVFGFLASILWLGVSLGAKHWQAKWEQRLRDFEGEVFPRLEFFAASETRIRDDAREGLGFYRAWWPKRFAYRIALWKPSVTFCMILLAFMFAIGWLALIVLSIWLRTPVAPTPRVRWFP